MLQEKKTKSYFDDIIGKSDTFDDLRVIWIRLLELASKHGWKFKPSKTKWGFRRIETVGFEWSAEGINIGKKNRDAVKELVFPRSKTELRGLLGLANQFRERIAGYALLVTALTELTRGTVKKQKIIATPEAIIEFENLKVVLSSPPVLQQFRYGRPTFVYTDASVGTTSGTSSDEMELPGGLGVVIVQTGEDGIDYVCAYASTGLTAAQKNYHIVRLELLAFVYACGKFYDWLAGISFVWRSDCRAHEFLHQAKYSSNSTIARYALTLAEFDFRVEWIPGITMIADCFSRLTLQPASDGEALTLPEIVFGTDVGSRIAAARKGKPVAPLLLYQAVPFPVRTEYLMEIDDELLGCQVVPVLRQSIIPVSSNEFRPQVIDLEVLPESPLLVSATEETPPTLEELDAWPKFTNQESQRLEAIRHLREWVRTKELKLMNEWLRPVLRDIGRRVVIDEEGVLRKNVRGVQLEVLDTPDRLRDILRACHEGLGHRGLRSTYKHFTARYWVPAAAKLIKRHILSCKVCQCFADAKINAIHSKRPGFSPRASDVFTHWSVDFTGPFPKDIATGMEYVIIAVEWVTKWAEAEVTRDASPETAAEFLYTRIVCRYGCIQSLQSDNGPHFVNPMLRCLTRLLKIRHHFSTPYYPQSNGRVERVVGTLKAMLRRTVAAAISTSKVSTAEEVRVVGVDLALDEGILNAIVAGHDEQSNRSPAVVDEEEEDVVSTGGVHWSPLLYTVLWVYRATPHSATGMSPALLALGKELRLPMDRPSDTIPDTDDTHKELVLQRLKWVIDAVPGLHELQAPRSTPAPPNAFQLGQKVWKRESKYDGKGFVPVFAPRWTGPFAIHSVYGKGAYKLRTIPENGKRVGYLRNPVNGYRLKPFVDGEVLK